MQDFANNATGRPANANIHWQGLTSGKLSSDKLQAASGKPPRCLDSMIAKLFAIYMLHVYR